MSSNPNSQMLSSTNKRTAAMEPSPKAQSESVESVRAKLRESLAASLALVSESQNKLPPVAHHVQNEVPSTPRKFLVDSQPAESDATTLDAASCHTEEKPVETLTSSSYESDRIHNGFHSSSQENFINETCKFDGEEFQLKRVSPDNEVPFINNFTMKDELLQGHDLCWASDVAVEGTTDRESHASKKPKLMDEEITRVELEQTLPCPQILANKIEAELFRLFGGVNKKYKEKGRSLLFNLKDRNNPELRERVISGEIPPERLCCMTAEELASKELSQWRIAKAEELAQMVVLPDSDVDIRRLVRKTHKGEFQVEFDQDDSVSVEVGLGVSSLTQLQSRSNDKAGQNPSKSKESESQVPPKPNETEAANGAVPTEKVVSVHQNHPSTVVTRSHDETDVMQADMVDELKDAEFLPPIVSLDEFMESHDKPPSQNIPEDVGQDTSFAVKKSIDSLDAQPDSSNFGSTEPVDTGPEKPDEVVKITRTDSPLKSPIAPVGSETDYSVDEIKSEHVWEGLLQLNISAMAMVIGFFRSGEKTSTNDWPSFLEIKGRVRLDAFEKFVQELPMSRSRAVMVVQFCWKEGSPEHGRMHLLEVADAYVADERVGFAEPVPGIELYLCPPHKNMIEMLGRHLPKEHSESLIAVRNGLIGIVVWRKAHVTPISPKNSYQRQNSKKQHSSLKRQQEKDANPKQSHPPLPFEPPPSNPNPPSDDDPFDDIPPGFGPVATAGRDEDDLPEFDFAGSKSRAKPFAVPNPAHGFRNSARPSPRPMEQMRNLIQKYGQGKMDAITGNPQPGQGTSIETEPWNDEDDIPEWQPHLDSQPRPPSQPHSRQPPSRLSIQLQAQPTHLGNQPLVPMPPQQALPPQPLVPLAPTIPIHLHPMRPQMGPTQGQHAMPPHWQPGMPWSQPFGPHGQSDIGFQANGLTQPCHFGDQSIDNQFHRTPGFGGVQNGMDWRPDISRSGGV